MPIDAYRCPQCEAEEVALLNQHWVLKSWHEMMIITRYGNDPIAVVYADKHRKVIAAAPAMFAALHAILFQVNQGPVLEHDACIAQARAAYRKVIEQ